MKKQVNYLLLFLTPFPAYTSTIILLIHVCQYHSLGEELGGGPDINRAKAPKGFYFDDLDREVDWDRVRMCMIQKIVKKGNVDSLLNFLPDIAYGDVSQQEGFDSPAGNVGC